MKKLLGFVVVGAGAAFATLMYLNSDKSPSNNAGGGAPIVKVAVPQLSGSALEGEMLFNTNCAACHGPNAAGQDGVAPPLVHKIYEPGHHADGSFYLAAARGVRAHHWPFGDMPPVPDVSEQDVTKIIAYVRTLQRENGIY